MNELLNRAYGYANHPEDSAKPVGYANHPKGYANHLEDHPANLPNGPQL